MHNILRENYFDMISEGKENIPVFLEFFSYWLRPITLCKNITLFWCCGPDCIMDNRECKIHCQRNDYTCQARSEHSSDTYLS